MATRFKYSRSAEIISFDGADIEVRNAQLIKTECGDPGWRLIRHLQYTQVVVCMIKLKGIRKPDGIKLMVCAIRRES